MSDVNNPQALFQAAKHAEQLLSNGTPEQSVIFTLTGQGISYENAKDIVYEITTGTIKNRLSAFEAPAARQLGLRMTGIGLIVGAVSAGIGLLMLKVLNITSGPLQIAYAVVGLGLLFSIVFVLNGLLSVITGWEPVLQVKQAPRPKRNRLFRLFK
jgi:hypothetical protein